MAKRDFAFGKDNFMWISISILLIIIGFALMSGGSSKDGVSFNPEIFNTQRIVIAPVITLFGFLLMVFGILKNSKKQEEKE